MDTALADCLSGESRIVLIEGATGSGKSALADTVAERARAAGAVVLSSVASPAERQVPLGVLRQLVRSGQDRVLPELTADRVTAPSIEAMQAFCSSLRELSTRTPVVLCLDDVEHADAESLQYLQYVARHARSAPVLVIVTGSLHAEAQNPVFTTELLRQPHFRRLRLEQLSPAEVAEVAARHNRTHRRAPATELHRISGGNPLLLRALLEEQEDAWAEDSSPSPSSFAPGSGGPYAQAVVACLHRCGPTATALAQAVAVLGEFSSPSNTVQLLGIGATAAHRGLAALEASGILDGLRFRHPSGHTSVLDEIAPETRAELHRRAAMVLRRAGSPATSVASHLLAASEGTVPRAGGTADLEVLRDAAEDLLVQNDAHRAVRLLELAGQVSSDEQSRGAVGIRLAQVTARFDPAASERQASTLLEALRCGALDAENVQPLADLLLTQGRVIEASTLLDGSDPAQSAASALDAVIDTDVAASERLLQSAILTDATLAPITQAVQSIIASDHPERAVPWTRKLLAETNRCQAPGWTAVFTTLHAEALLRLGDLDGAHAHAVMALQALPDNNGSTFHCAPTAVLVRACSGMGRYAQASRYAGHQIPQRLLATLPGLGFLRARGLHHLAVNQPQAALADFLEIGRLMESWGVDRPAYLPWRSDAAEALLRLGKPRQAEQYVLQQLSLPDARRAWVRGVSLRLRAMTGDPKQRTSTLSQAIEELHRSGDRLETSRAMADLGRALQSDGSPSKGSAMVRSAWNLAKECQATALCKEILPDVPLTAPARNQSAPEGGGTSPEVRLSSSEQRVATLAAQGMTNREISAKLYLTVSTVEQHLTRVYRKLQISSRGDLPLDLELGSRVSI
ncbi:hypothetical protein BGK72_38530 [Streptomyces agglomeratus]|nr:hypothetical protein BGK72_38530 [Streptomyces agglomeratus]